MPKLDEFFKGSQTTLGVFYPNHYLVAVFRDLAAAKKTVTKLHFAGFTRDAVIAAEGKDVIELAGEGSPLMQALSRFFSTEQKFTDHDVEHARRGAGFLAVHCPTEDAKNKAWGVIEPEVPLDARYYASAGIEHLAGDLKTD